MLVNEEGIASLEPGDMTGNIPVLDPPDIRVAVPASKVAVLAEISRTADPWNVVLIQAALILFLDQGA